MNHKVTGPLFEKITRQLFEIIRQVNQPNGYPFDPTRLQEGLQRLIEGQFADTAQKTNDLIHTVVQKVDRTRTPAHIINATGRKKYLNNAVVDMMPHGEGGEVTLVFFRPTFKNRRISCDDLAQEYASRNLTPDPYALAAFMADNPTYDDKQYVACQWQNAQGDYGYATFNRWDGERDVNVYSNNNDWDDGWVFAGSRKS